MFKKIISISLISTIMLTIFSGLSANFALAGPDDVVITPDGGLLSGVDIGDVPELTYVFKDKDSGEEYEIATPVLDSSDNFNIIRAQLNDGEYTVCIAGFESCKDVTKLPGQELNVLFDQPITVADLDAFNNQNLGTNSCYASIPGLGWIVCKVLTFIQDAVVGFIETIFQFMLKVEFLNKRDSNGGYSVIYAMWRVAQGIGLAILAGSYIMMAVGYGFSGGAKYAFKTAAPKFALAAIAIILSFDIMTILIDFSNLAGEGLTTMIEGLISDTGAAKIAPGGFSTGAGLVALTTIVPFKLWQYFWFMLLIFAISLLAAFIALMIRQIIIISAVIMAPIAFALAVMPGAEKVFKTWRTWTVSMLLMYPAVMMFFAASDIFAMVATNTEFSDPIREELAGIFGLAIAAAPLAAIPFLFRLSTASLGVVGKVLGQQLDPFKRDGLLKNARESANARGTNLAVGGGIPVTNNIPSMFSMRRELAGVPRNSATGAMGSPDSRIGRAADGLIRTYTNIGAIAGQGLRPDTKMLSDGNKLIGQISKEMEEENFNRDAYRMVFKSDEQAQDSLTSEITKLADMRSTGATDQEIELQADKIRQVETANLLAKKYRKSFTGKAAALIELAKMGQLEDSQREWLYQSTSYEDEGSSVFAQQVWDKASYAQKSENPVTSMTKLNGTVDGKSLHGKLQGASTSFIGSINDDGWKGILENRSFLSIPKRVRGRIYTSETRPGNISTEIFEEARRYEMGAQYLADKDKNNRSIEMTKVREQFRGNLPESYLGSKNFLRGMHDSALPIGNSDHISTRREISQKLSTINTDNEYMSRINPNPKPEEIDEFMGRGKFVGKGIKDEWSRRVDVTRSISNGELKKDFRLDEYIELPDSTSKEYTVPSYLSDEELNKRKEQEAKMNQQFNNSQQTNSPRQDASKQEPVPTPPASTPPVSQPSVFVDPASYTPEEPQVDTDDDNNNPNFDPRNFG